MMWHDLKSFFLLLIIIIIIITVCKAKIDLAFLIDGSGSIEHYGRGNFRRCLNFVKNMVRSFKISPSHTRVAAALFSSSARRMFGFNKYRTMRQVLRAIGRIRYPRGGTKIGRALNYVRRYIFGRSRRTKVLIVMTDGKSYDKVTGPAAILKRMGVKIFAFGIGRHYKMSQLIHVASSRRHVFTASFRTMSTVVRAIKRRACTGRYFTVRALHIEFWRAISLLDMVVFLEIEVNFVVS
jgi:collagen type VI alpha